MKHLLIATILAAFVAGAVQAADDPASGAMKSQSAAWKYSLWGTLGPTIAGFATGGGAGASLAAAGLILGPGLGHAYAGNGKQFYAGAVLRGLGLGVVALYGDDVVAIWGNDPDNEPAELGVAVALGLVIYSTIHDIVTADNSARQYNESHGLSLAPTLDPQGTTPGLALVFRF